MKKFLFVVFATLCGVLVIVGYFGKKSEDRYNLSNKVDSADISIYITKADLFPETHFVLEDFPIDLEEVADGSKVASGELMNITPVQRVTPIMPKGQSSFSLFVSRNQSWGIVLLIIMMSVLTVSVLRRYNRKQ